MDFSKCKAVNHLIMSYGNLRVPNPIPKCQQEIRGKGIRGAEQNEHLGGGGDDNSVGKVYLDAAGKHLPLQKISGVACVFDYIDR